MFILVPSVKAQVMRGLVFCLMAHSVIDVGRGVDVHEALAIDGGQDVKAAPFAVFDHAHDDAGLIAIGVGIDRAGGVGFAFEEAADGAIGFGVERDEVLFVFDAGEGFARASSTAPVASMTTSSVGM